jgi:hypothetical protein
MGLLFRFTRMEVLEEHVAGLEALIEGNEGGWR